MPANLLGWVLFVIFTPICIYISFLRFRKRTEDISYYLAIAAIWAVIAMVLDYIFIVTAFHSLGYYKLDVFVYYATTFIIPLLIGWKYGMNQSEKK